MKKLRYKSPSEDWHKNNNPRANCTLSQMVDVNIEFKISLRDLTGLTRTLGLMAAECNQASEALNNLNEVITENLKRFTTKSRNEKETYPPANL